MVHLMKHTVARCVNMVEKPHAGPAMLPHRE
jgi:ABC-type histidine transport system ATPase subunit